MARPRYEPALDGLRALAVVAVLAYHDGRLAGGFLGVSTFFTLSGFLITRLLLTEHGATGRVAKYTSWATQARRNRPPKDGFAGAKPVRRNRTRSFAKSDNFNLDA